MDMPWKPIRGIDGFDLRAVDGAGIIDGDAPATSLIAPYAVNVVRSAVSRTVVTGWYVIDMGVP
jgi:hypothetical protein